MHILHLMVSSGCDKIILKFEASSTFRLLTRLIWLFFSVNASKETAKEMKIGPFTASGIRVAERGYLWLLFRR